jgi:hypothetical protein
MFIGQYLVAGCQFPVSGFPGNRRPATGNSLNLGAFHLFLPH